MISGDTSLNQLGGPVAIAEQAGQSVSLGWQAFAGFLALLSISLGILNLLPIPPLDGGQIVLFTVEAIMGKPPAEVVQMGLQKIGIALVMLLMLVAVGNDFIRLFS